MCNIGLLLCDVISTDSHVISTNSHVIFTDPFTDSHVIFTDSPKCVAMTAMIMIFWLELSGWYIIVQNMTSTKYSEQGIHLCVNLYQALMQTQYLLQFLWMWSLKWFLSGMNSLMKRKTNNNSLLDNIEVVSVGRLLLQAGINALKSKQ